MATQKERIEEYFQSDDKELRKVGQLLCHTLRMNYYLFTAPMAIPLGKPPIRKVIRYSLDSNSFGVNGKLLRYYGIKIYEIKLKEKHGRNVKIKCEHEQATPGFWQEAIL